MASPSRSMALFVAALAVAAGLGLAENPAQKKSTAQPKKSSTSKAPAGSSKAIPKTPPAGKGASTRYTAAKGTSAHRTATTASKTPPVWHPRQLQPTPDRYRDIQQALVSKGYLQGEPSGVWNQESIDALRRFQEEQKLEPTGKIDSLSLIKLGLGPKHETTAAVPPAAPPAAPLPEVLQSAPSAAPPLTQTPEVPPPSASR